MQQRWKLGHSFWHRVCLPRSLGIRSLVSQRFVFEQNGQPVEFVSQKTDSDVLIALQDQKSEFSQTLLKAGQQGLWSRKMRAWAHFLTCSKEEKARLRPVEDIGETPAEEVLVRLDSREHKLRDYISESDSEFPVSVETLRVADVIIGSPPHEIFIERKSMTDLVSSVFDTRLYNQLGNKLHATEYVRFRSLVIVEGNFSALWNDFVPSQKRVVRVSQESYQVKRRLVNATLMRLSLRDQIAVMRSEDIAGTYEIIRTIADEYPRLISSGPKQYSIRIDKPFRPRRGEDPKSVLVDQLRCIRGVSQRSAHRLAGKHTNMQAFLSEMSTADDSVEWLVSRGQSDSEQFSHATAVLLAEALAGPQAVAREGFIRSLMEVEGVTRASAISLVNACGSRKELRKCLEDASDPISIIDNFAPKLTHPTKRRLVSAVVGEDGLSFEQHFERIASIEGISKSTARELATTFPKPAFLCNALEGDPCAPEPVGRAMILAQISRPAARRLVSNFLDGNVLAWDDLVACIFEVPGISMQKARMLADQFAGERGQLLDALMRDIANQQQTVGPETGLRLSIAEKLLDSLT